jgi:hypothetical protein
MKKILCTLTLVFLTALAVSAQGPQARKIFTTTVVAADTGVLETGSGVLFHQLVWNVSGTITTCQVQLDQSADNATWSSQVIATQACTVNGSSAVSVSTTTNYVRINVTTLSGGGTLTVTYQGFTSSSALTNGAGSNPLGASLNVKAFPYSAVGDGKFFVDGVTNAGNNNLTSITATFTASDVGHTITCYKTPLSGTNVQWTPGQTTVASFVSAGTITYSGANAGANSGQYCTITNPADHTGIDQAFLDAKTTTPAVGEGNSFQTPAKGLYFPIGIYGLDKGFNNLISTGNENCVGFHGDGWKKTVLIPEFNFTTTGLAGIIINDRCQGVSLEDFTIEMASNPINGFANGGVIRIGGTTTLRNVGIFDTCTQGAGGNLFGILVDVGTDVVLDHPVVISSGTCNQLSGGLYWSPSEGDIYSPFLSNTSQNFLCVNTTAGNNGSGSRIWGGVIDEGSVSTWQNCVDFWAIGVTWTGGANCVSIDATSIVWFFGGYCGTFATNTGSGPTVASGGQMFVSDMHVRGQNAANYCWNIAAAGGLIDLGGNQCTLAGGATTYAAGSFVSTSSLTHTYPEPFLPALPTSGTAQTIAAFTPTTAVSVKNFTIVSSNTPTCATPPTFSIANGTTTITQTFASASNINGPFTPTQTASADTFASGTQITLSITTAAYACASAPINMNFSIEWQSTAPSF